MRPSRAFFNAFRARTLHDAKMDDNASSGKLMGWYNMWNEPSAKTAFVGAEYVSRYVD